MKLFVCSQYAVRGTVGHRMGQYSITIVIIQNEYVIVTSTGWGDKSARLICKYLPSSTRDVQYIRKYCTVVVSVGRIRWIKISDRVQCGVRRRKFRGSDIFPCLIEMPFDSGAGSRWIFAQR